MTTPLEVLHNVTKPTKYTYNGVMYPSLLIALCAAYDDLGNPRVLVFALYLFQLDARNEYLRNILQLCKELLKNQYEEMTPSQLDDLYKSTQDAESALAQFTVHSKMISDSMSLKYAALGIIKVVGDAISPMCVKCIPRNVYILLHELPIITPIPQLDHHNLEPCLVKCNQCGININGTQQSILTHFQTEHRKCLSYKSIQGIIENNLAIKYCKSLLDPLLQVLPHIHKRLLLYPLPIKGSDLIIHIANLEKISNGLMVNTVNGLLDKRHITIINDIPPSKKRKLDL